MSIKKFGFAFDFSKEFLLINSGFPQKGTWEELPLTEEDIAAHARAKAALEELESNPWIYSGYEPDELRPLQPGHKFTPAETDEEWMARWEDAGCPDFHGDQITKLMEGNILSAMNSSTRTGFHRA